MTTAERLLAEREQTHGPAVERMRVKAGLCQAYRRVTGCGMPEVDEAVCMILDKISRIACGDPTYADHWNDIIGYAEIGKQCAGVEDGGHDA